MKEKLVLMALSIILLCTPRVYSQESMHSFEVGIGGSAVNHSRTMLSDFHVTKGGDYVFSLEEKSLYGGINLYAAYELKPWLFLDAQGTVGLARHYGSGSLKQGGSILAGPGLQFRPCFGEGWVQPYLRLGVNYYHKDFPAYWFGTFEGDFTREGVWKAEDSWNKGSTFDKDTYIPVSAGIGVVGWLSERVGIRIEGNYLRSLGSKGANFAQGSAGLVFRFGGRSLRPAPAPERIVEKLIEKEVVKEVPVEMIREVLKEVPCGNTIDVLMDNVTFDFDKAELTPDSEIVLDEVAKIIASYPEDRFLVSGHTDARGGETYNEQLSVARARAVYDALILRGVPESQLCYRGFGKRAAVVPGSAGDDVRRGDRKVVLERITWKPLWNYLINNK